jgi:hypothetical protein
MEVTVLAAQITDLFHHVNSALQRISGGKYLTILWLRGITNFIPHAKGIKVGSTRRAIRITHRILMNLKLARAQQNKRF